MYQVKEIEQEVNDFSKHINPEMDSESLTGKTNETETKDWQKRDAFVAPVRLSQFEMHRCGGLEELGERNRTFQMEIETLFCLARG